MEKNKDINKNSPVTQRESLLTLSCVPEDFICEYFLFNIRSFILNFRVLENKPRKFWSQSLKLNIQKSLFARSFQYFIAEGISIFLPFPVKKK